MKTLMLVLLLIVAASIYSRQATTPRVVLENNMRPILVYHCTMKNSVTGYHTLISSSIPITTIPLEGCTLSDFYTKIEYIPQ